MPDFLLSKWYFDLLDEHGRGVIGYQAMLTWGKLKLGYTGNINFYHPDQITDENNFTSKNFSEVSTQTELGFETDKLKGVWKALDAPINHELYNTPSGKINWYCAQPKSAVTLETKEGIFTGHGYAEKIELTLPPWKIPIKELIWGRYHSEANTLVWIRWKGSYPQTLVFFNGKRIEQAEVSETSISFDNHTLLISNTRTIRESTVGESVFKYLGSIMKYFPSAIMTLHEVKWCATGVLMADSKRVDSGMVIHELVKWP